MKKKIYEKPELKTHGNAKKVTAGTKAPNYEPGGLSES